MHENFYNKTLSCACLFHISRRHKNILYAHLLILIIDISQYNRNLGISRYIIKAFLPIGIRLTGSLRGYRDGKRFRDLKISTSCDTISVRLSLLTGTPPIDFKRLPKGGKTTLFHHESSVTADRKISQFPYEKSQLLVWGATQITHFG